MLAIAIATAALIALISVGLLFLKTVLFVRRPPREVKMFAVAIGTAALLALSATAEAATIRVILCTPQFFPDFTPIKLNKFLNAFSRRV